MSITSISNDVPDGQEILIWFVLHYCMFNKRKWADTDIVSSHENKQKGYKKWLKLLEME